MLSCRDMCEKAGPLVDGELKGWPLLKVRLHLLFCANCTNFVSQVRRTRELVRRSLSSDKPTAASKDLKSAFKNRLGPKGP
jgi:predicted anti-sigma-YlaC factor YlaD